MLYVSNLNKKYEKFCLSNVSFEIKPGTIMGFIGRNGSGKTTTLKAIMNLIPIDSGTINVLGKPIKENEAEIKQNVAFTLCDMNFYVDKTIKQLTNVTSKFYKEWNQQLFDTLCKQFDLDQSKRLRDLSSGMKVKYTLAVALSHNAKLLILDEPTNGLDPSSRDEVILLFKEFIKNGNRSILFSTHITSDLEKCADYITYINNGLIKYTGTTHDFFKQYLLINSTEKLSNELKEKIIGFRDQNGSWEGLININDKNLFIKYKLTTPTLEQIMIFLERKNYEIASL